MVKTAFIYLRVSTEKQERDGAGLDVQLDTCQAWAAEHGVSVTEIFSDSQTGMQYRNRRDLTRMRERVRVGEPDMVLFYAMDRLARRAMHQAVLIDEAEHADVQYQSCTEDFDNTTEGQLVRSILGAMAEMERDKIVGRTQGGLEKRVESGKMLANGRAPYGYRWVEIDGKKTHYEIVDSEAAVLRRAYLEVLAGRSARQIAIAFSAENLPTAKGGTWVSGNLSKMLQNPIYKGCPEAWRYSGEHERRKAKLQGEEFEPLRKVKQLVGGAPAIVSPEIWDAVAEALPERKKQATRNTRNPEESLLRGGIAVCGYCGNFLSVKSGGGTQRKTEKNGRVSTWTRKRSYNDSDGSRQRHGCPSFSIDGALLDNVVWQHVVEQLNQPAHILERLRFRKAEDPTTVERETLERRRAVVERKRSNLQKLALMQDDDDYLAMLSKEIKDLTAELRQINDALVDLDAEHSSWLSKAEQLRKAEDWITRLRDRLRTQLTYEQQRTMLTALGITVRVYRHDHDPRVLVEWNVPLGDPEVFALDLTGTISPNATNLQRKLLATVPIVNTAASTSIYNVGSHYARLSFVLAV